MGVGYFPTGEVPPVESTVWVSTPKIYAISRAGTARIRRAAKNCSSATQVSAQADSVESAFERSRESLKGLKTFTWKSGPESGLDWTVFAQQRVSFRYGRQGLIGPLPSEVKIKQSRPVSGLKLSHFRYENI
jgi:hypothetical protein